VKIAIPLAGGQLAQHFGHCEEFVVFDVDGETRTIERSQTVVAPPHEPGLLPQWLKELGADVVITGGMGSRAQELLGRSGIAVIVGVSPNDPRAVVTDYLEGRLKGGENICDH
jgi:predicted Fe-Mo cluster-binding NifX family protein